LTPKTFNLPKGILTVYKGSPMNWWSAFNLCQSHGKQMVTMADLGLADSGTNTNCYFNSEHSSYATKPCICNGGSDSDCSATNMAIRNADETHDYLWLADDNKLSSDVARGIRLSSGVVDWNNRHGNSYPICRDP
jgi:hypothetical protein